MNPALQVISWFGLAPGTAAPESPLVVCLLLAVAAALVGVVSAAQKPRVKADKQNDAEGNAKAFTLSLGAETVALDPGKPWVHVDRFKWVTRGLIEEPQSFHVLRDGTVEMNGEKIRLSDPEGVAKLEFEVNKHHTSAGPQVLPAAAAAPTRAPAQAPGESSGKVRFKVRLDHLGHVMIACLHGAERVETGLRGLSTLIHNGLMLKPGSFHLDPLQRFVEIDGTRFECRAAGAQQLEETLNREYAPTLKAVHGSAIEIKENPASPTGFDIHFVTVCVGARFEVKGHLTQEQLDVLQDSAKSNLLQPRIVLRLSPPYLLARRKRPDGGEERIPELADVHYLRATGQQIQQFLNHPLIRRNSGPTADEVRPTAELLPEAVLELRIVRHPKDSAVLGLECVTIERGSFAWRALTHHNVAELEQTGVFLPHLDVTLSLDNRKLSTRNTQTGQEETITIDTHSSDEELIEASRLLTAALKPPKSRPVAPATPPPAPIPPADAGPREQETGSTATEELAQLASPNPQLPLLASPTARAAEAIGKTDGPAMTASLCADLPVGVPRVVSSPASEPMPAHAETELKPVPKEAPADAADPLFRETDPLRVNVEMFRRLGPHFGVAVEDLRLSLPRIFENRRFEVICFCEQEIGSVLDLRSEDFYGFYLSHISERRIDFVYACRGTHIEWGADKCVVQPSVSAESEEFKSSALLGLAQTAGKEFVFVVTPEYRQWVKRFEAPCREAFAHFRTAGELGADLGQYTLIWPERESEAAAPG